MMMHMARRLVFVHEPVVRQSSLSTGYSHNAAVVAYAHDVVAHQVVKRGGHQSLHHSFRQLSGQPVAQKTEAARVCTSKWCGQRTATRYTAGNLSDVVLRTCDDVAVVGLRLHRSRTLWPAPAQTEGEVVGYQQLECMPCCGQRTVRSATHAQAGERSPCAGESICPP